MFAAIIFQTRLLSFFILVHAHTFVTRIHDLKMFKFLTRNTFLVELRLHKTIYRNTLPVVMAG